MKKPLSIKGGRGKDLWDQLLPIHGGGSYAFRSPSVFLRVVGFRHSFAGRCRPLQFNISFTLLTKNLRMAERLPFLTIPGAKRHGEMCSLFALLLQAL
ncbi:hypothetical protein HMPREF9374_1242 [Desmospora sp. 8437]|nr:hypothetical protein HMPREF9374_1242 [Desmospora sp. 8437]